MVNWLNLSCSWLYKFNCYTRDSLKLKCMVSSTWFGKNVCNLASSSPKIPCGMLCCSVYRPLRLDPIDRIFSCPSGLYGCQYVSISNKIPTFLAPKCPSLISRIFFKCSSSENHSKLLMIKIKELRYGTTNFPAPKIWNWKFSGNFPGSFPVAQTLLSAPRFGDRVTPRCCRY